MLRRLFGKGTPAKAGHDASAQLIRDYFRHKANGQGYTLSHSQLRVIDCMAQQASLLFGATAQNPPSLYLHGSVGRGKSWLLDGFFRHCRSRRNAACISTSFSRSCIKACSAIANRTMRWP